MKELLIIKDVAYANSIASNVAVTCVSTGGGTGGGTSGQSVINLNIADPEFDDLTIGTVYVSGSGSIPAGAYITAINTSTGVVTISAALTGNIAASVAITWGLSITMTTINNLTAGALAMFTEFGELVLPSTAVAQLAGIDNVYFAVGQASGTNNTLTKISQKVQCNTSKAYRKLYKAPVKQVTLIGDDGTIVPGGTLPTPTLGLPASITVGDTINLRITDTLDRFDNLQGQRYKERYEETARVGDTYSLMIARLLAQIAANPNSIIVPPVIATDVFGTPYTGFKLAAKDFDQTFEVSLDGVWAGATIWYDDVSFTTGSANVVPVVFGVGTPTEITALEQYCQTEEGDTARGAILPQNWFAKPTLVASTATYDVYSINWSRTRSNPIHSFDASNQTIQIAVPNTFSNITAANILLLFVAAFGTTTTLS